MTALTKRCSCRPNVPWMELQWVCEQCGEREDASSLLDDFIAAAAEADRLRGELDEAWDVYGGKLHPEQTLADAIRHRQNEVEETARTFRAERDEASLSLSAARESLDGARKQGRELLDDLRDEVSKHVELRCSYNNVVNALAVAREDRDRLAEALRRVRHECFTGTSANLDATVDYVDRALAGVKP